MRSTQHLQLLLSAGLAGLLLTALPVGFDGSTLSLAPTQAWAGGGHGHGNAGETSGEEQLEVLGRSHVIGSLS